METGDILSLHCDTLALSGAGIGRCGGMVVFVPSLLPGEDADVAITEVRKNFAVGSVVKRHSDAPERIEPDCPYTAQCGGCVFRHLRYDAELLAKEQAVRDALRRFSVLATVLPCRGASPDRPRNKAVFHFTPDGRFGYYAAGTHTVLPIDDCLLLPRVFTEIADYIAEFCRFADLHPLYLQLRASTDGCITAAISLPGVSSADKRLFRLAERITSYFPAVSGILLGSAEQPEAETRPYTVLFGEGALWDTIGPLRLRSTARSFRQVNFGALAVLLDEIDEAASPQPGENIADLYCGTGMIGQYLAARHPGITLTGVEINENAVRDAEYNAKENRLSGVRFFCGDAAKYVREAGMVDLAILDPPRAGLSDAMRRQILELRPARIVYVSCNPSSMAHDMSLLTEFYTPSYIRPVDLFPRTGNTESVAKLIRK